MPVVIIVVAVELSSLNTNALVGDGDALHSLRGERMKKQMPEKFRQIKYSNKEDGCNGLFFVNLPKFKKLKVVVSDGGGWDHVSVSLSDRCPTWEEMCLIKDLFFEEEETVVQFHPSKSEHVNNHPYCLHLWKRQATPYELPPSIFTGIKL